MKRTRLSLTALLLVAVLCLAAVPVSAADGLHTATFTVGDQVVSKSTIVDGAVYLASEPNIAAGFVGWTATVGDETIFLPAGARCTGLSADVTFTAVTVNFDTDTGCSVRLRDDKVGLRFTSTVATKDYDNLVALLGGTDKISFGTYIVPGVYVTEAGGFFTLEALAAKGHNKYIDVPAYGFFSKTDTTFTIAGSVTNILKDNYTLEYSGVGYMKVTFSNGATKTVYAAFNQTENTRSILKTVLGAYNDRDESYGNLVLESTGSTHSPYTNTELALCRAFLDRVVMVGHDSKYNYFVLPTGYYVSPWKITFSADKYGRSTIFAEPPANMTAEDAMGVYLDGMRIRMRRTKVENGVLTFVHDSYVTVG